MCVKRSCVACFNVVMWRHAAPRSNVVSQGHEAPVLEMIVNNSGRIVSGAACFVRALVCSRDAPAAITLSARAAPCCACAQGRAWPGHLPCVCMCIRPVRFRAGASADSFLRARTRHPPAAARCNAMRGATVTCRRPQRQRAAVGHVFLGCVMAHEERAPGPRHLPGLVRHRRPRPRRKQWRRRRRRRLRSRWPRQRRRRGWREIGG